MKVLLATLVVTDTAAVFSVVPEQTLAPLDATLAAVWFEIATRVVQATETISASLGIDDVLMYKHWLL